MNVRLNKFTGSGTLIFLFMCVLIVTPSWGAQANLETELIYQVTRDVLLDSSISPDKESIVVATNTGIYLYTIPDFANKLQIFEWEVRLGINSTTSVSVSWSPAGDRIAVYSNSFITPSIIIIDTSGNQIEQLNVSNQTSEYFDILWAANGRIIIIESMGTVIDTQTGEELFDRIVMPSPTKAAWSNNDNRFVYVDSEQNAHIVSSGRIVQSLELQNTLIDIQWHDNYILFVHLDELFVWNIETGQETRQDIDHLGSDARAKFSPDGSTFALYNSNSRVTLWETTTLQQKHTLAVDNSGRVSVDWVSESQFILSVEHKTLQIREVDGRLITQNNAFRGIITAVQLSSDGNMIFVFNSTETIEAISLSDDKILFEIEGTNALWSPDSRSFAAVENNGTLINIFAIESQAIIAQYIAGSNSFISATEWSPTGNRIAVATFQMNERDEITNQMLELWTPETDEEQSIGIGPIDLPGDIITGISWSAMGDMIATTTFNDNPKIYTTENGELLHEIYPQRMERGTTAQRILWAPTEDTVALFSLAFEPGLFFDVARQDISFIDFDFVSLGWITDSLVALQLDKSIAIFDKDRDLILSQLNLTNSMPVTHMNTAHGESTSFVSANNDTQIMVWKLSDLES